MSLSIICNSLMKMWLYVYKMFCLHLNPEQSGPLYSTECIIRISLSVFYEKYYCGITYKSSSYMEGVLTWKKRLYSSYLALELCRNRRPSIP